eukprot:m51a1_g3194 hypothetical protein (249) ;mRNA; f:447312-448466
MRDIRLAASVLVLAAAAAACDWGNMDAHCSYTSQPDWSYMMFTQTWPGTFCEDGCCRVPRGTPEVPVGFTIHGLWPNYDSPAYPSCCKSQFNNTYLNDLINSNSDLKTELKTYWPALKKCMFVQYEFDKHGTCATQSAYSGDSGLYDYLRAGLYLRGKFDVYKALSNAGIEPGNEYDPYKQIIRIHCDRATPRQLSEVRMCVGRPTERTRATPELIDCPDTLTERDGCDPSGVSLPYWPSFISNGCDL